MKSVNDFLKIFVSSEPCIDNAVVSGVIAVRVRFKDRREIDRIDPEFFHVRDPVEDLKDPVGQDTVIFKRSAAKA